MAMNKKEIGGKGEEEAFAHLRRLGYRILQRNYRCRMGELDIVAMQGGVLVFVEVRTRTGLTHGYPEESVNVRKQNKLRMLAQQFLLAHPKLLEVPCRFDVVAVHFPGDQSVISLKHIENAF